MEALESKTYTTEKTLAERMNERLAELHMTKAEAAMRMNYSLFSSESVPQWKVCIRPDRDREEDHGVPDRER